MVVEISTGLRRGELLGLRWRDIDLDAGRLHVSATLQRITVEQNSQSQLGFVEPKTPRARRTVALRPSTVETLRRHRKAQNERRLASEAWHETDAVFDRGDGRPLDPGEFGREFKRLAKKAGLEGTRFHDVRHGFATALLLQGVHPKVASDALGHSSVAFTLDTYSHVLPSMQDTAAQAIEDALAAGGQELARTQNDRPIA
ncbi:MAG: site-specific integrase [Actinomycetota bacterium]